MIYYCKGIGKIYNLNSSVKTVRLIHSQCIHFYILATPTGSHSSVGPFSAPPTTNTTPQATFKYEYMSNSLSVRLEPSSNTSREEVMTSPIASLNPRTGKFDNYDFYEHKENALEGKLDGLHTSIELQQKRKLLDEIESLKKQKIKSMTS